MMILVSYDVKTDSPDGRRRLRKVAKLCQNWGQRVQYSVFECLLDPAQWVVLKSALTTTINMEEDSLRFYQLGANWKNRVEHVGAKASIDPEGLLLF